jgi:hypothetical protein
MLRRDNLNRGAQLMTLNVSQQTEARLTEEAQRQGVSVDTLIERLVSERTANAPAPGHAPPATAVFEQGLGLFSSPEDASLIDEVVSLAYTERRRPGIAQPLAL